MHCRSCELTLEAELAKIAHVTRAEANHKTGTIVIVSEGGEPDKQAVHDIIERSGYAVADAAGRLPLVTREMEAYVAALFAIAIVFVSYLILDHFGWLAFSFGSGTLDLSRLGLVLLIGLAAGISTCAALIGGLVLGVAARYSELHPERSFRDKFIPQLWFNAGRVGGFAFFGALLGLLGEQFQLSLSVTAFLTLVVGLVMLLIGLQLSEIFPRLSHFSFVLPKSLSRALGLGKRGESEYSHRGAALSGALTFFLPCGFTQAVQLSVITLGDALSGAIIMAVFALGTVPGLLVFGGLGTAIRGGMRRVFFSIVAVVLVAFGLWNVQNSWHLFGWSGDQGAALTTGSVTPGDVQVIRMTQDADGYHPSALPELRAGVPVRLIIDSQDTYSCASSFVIPELGIERRLKPGENVIEFTPTRAGKIPFSCSMGMYRGTLEVR
jgi:sulfite exporter TauE/SafE/copper chaperone CopZ